MGEYYSKEELQKWKEWKEGPKSDLDKRRKLNLLNIATLTLMIALLMAGWLFLKTFFSGSEYEKGIKEQYALMMQDYYCFPKLYLDSQYQNRGCLYAGYYYPDCAMVNKTKPEWMR